MIRFFLFSILLICLSCQPLPMQLTDFSSYPVYEGTDLGLTYTPEKSVFRIWSPPATEARVLIYEAGIGGKSTEQKKMDKGERGTWVAAFPEDLKGKFYAFQVKVNGNWSEEVVDPYAKAVGVNGHRGQVIDMKDTNPARWLSDERPFLRGKDDVIIYELHVRDVSIHESSGIVHKGKFTGLTETGTLSPQGLSTGLDHIRELGVTHVHLLPSFDFRSIDETKLDQAAYNWGYDPQNYNVPEGSYSNNPYDGATRIREFKEVVQSLHDQGLRVILDVVYNHTGATEHSLFNELVPGYYYRQNNEGGFSNASACGNETASDRYMMRKFIVESVAYWAEAYHIDGFRFDLMGIHDIETMNAVTERLKQIDPSIIVYGEGWTAGDTPLPEPERALKKYAWKMPDVAVFSDDIRDAIKGHVFTPEQAGFVSGHKGLKESVKFGVVASTFHPQLNYTKVNYSDTAYAAQPLQTITYASCHDNHTLWDKLAIANPDATEEERVAMHKLALGIVLTSQGIPFLHAGTEMLRTKQGVENSFESPDAINAIDWTRKRTHADVLEYVQGLIRLRRNHPAFRMKTAAEVRQNLTFLDNPWDNMVAFQINGAATGDTWQDIIVIYNGEGRPAGCTIPQGKWYIAANDETVQLSALGSFTSNSILLKPYSLTILYRNPDQEDDYRN